MRRAQEQIQREVATDSLREAASEERHVAARVRRGPTHLQIASAAAGRHFATRMAPVAMQKLGRIRGGWLGDAKLCRVMVAPKLA